jgi:hypothetical protein
VGVQLWLASRTRVGKLQKRVSWEGLGSGKNRPGAQNGIMGRFVEAAGPELLKRIAFTSKSRVAMISSIFSVRNYSEQQRYGKDSATL